MLSTASRPIGGKDNLPKRHTAWPNLQPQNLEAARGSNPHQKHQAAGLGTTAGGYDSSSAPSSNLTAEQQQAVDAADRPSTTKATSVKNRSRGNNPTSHSPTSGQKKKPIPAVPKAPLLSTPNQPSRAVSAPPQAGNLKPHKSHQKAPEVIKSSPRRHPQQMQTGNVPKEFNSTKNTLFVHIKILWGLLTQDAVPRTPELQNLQEFYNRFSNSDEVDRAAKVASSPALISSNKFQLFQNAVGGKIKYGRQVLHLGSNNVRYAQGLMIHLGLRVWSPNLEEDSASLYNAAHRIAAITTFQDLVAARAYDYMNVCPKMATDTTLIIQAYNHFVHYLCLVKYNKEKKQAGKLAKEARSKGVSKSRKRLQDARKNFAILNTFPKRYVNIISSIGAHSDDEYKEKHKIYKIETLGYSSKNASKFIRRLDILMLKASEQDPLSKRKRRVQKLPKIPLMSSCTLAPSNLPIDFYDPTWYQSLTPAQQQKILDTQSVAFLPDAGQSLMPKSQRHPDEKLSDSSFTRKYWGILVEPYGLLEEESLDDSESEEETEGRGKSRLANESEEEGHDLNNPSPDVSEDEFYNEGNAGDLYDDFVDDADEEDNGEEDYNGNNASGDETNEDDEYENGDNYQDTKDVPMHDQRYGVDERTLAVMEEEEEGW
ncbi:hypothetical protein PCASD_05466 [Puccinia coronata f. sp. avenae]|uniref:Uncharacterized protein n=1 Tax=Puccinia coronata f. sp. avenae TaxID=200324 RepID=A0A2N5V8T1_9BASI|nr:hypothetical protein PCASD_05466 [Puccinia coronata f. sp. avenae]